MDPYDLDVVAVEVKIDIGVADSQIGEGDLTQPLRKRWGDDQAVGWRVGVDTGERRDEVDDGARGPGLGDVCSQVLDGEGSLVAGEASEHLWEPGVLEALCGV
jgi:hypothetical protein